MAVRLLMRKLNFILLAALLLLAFTAVHAQGPTIAMTVDDLPFASGKSGPPSTGDARHAAAVKKAILQAFTRHQIPATGFVIEKTAEELGIDVSTSILRQWTRPGFDLGNHFYSHPDVNGLTAPEIEQEITSGETTFGPLLNVHRQPMFLRFPYNHTGDTAEKHDAVAAFIAARGYSLAPCTIDNSDYEFTDAYVFALDRHDQRTAAKIEAEYVTYTGLEIDYYTKLNKTVLGYAPPHVMLLHDSPLNARAIEAVIMLFQTRGYRFVSLTEALKDPAYSIPEIVTKYGPMWGYRWANERKVSVRGFNEPQPPSWIEEYVKKPKASAAP
jgi:peptidoglycan-N-acetylglucosamine deacetylase